MQYRRLGGTGLKVSAVSIGGWLTLGSSVDESKSEQIIETAIDSGINFIDLADVYGGGKAEKVVGDAIAKYERRKLVISSKLFWPMSEDPNDRGLSRKHIFEGLERSLERIGTDYLDIYFCHRWDDQTPLLETMRAMTDLIKAGKVHYWGTSMWSAKQLQHAYKLADEYDLYAPVVEQPRYNLLHREIENRVMPTAYQLGMGLTVWSPLAQGMLTGKYNDGVPEGSRGEVSDWLESDLTDENLDKTRRFLQIAENRGLPPEQMALAWLISREEVSSVITGATKVAHIESNVEAASIQLDESTTEEIDELFK